MAKTEMLNGVKTPVIEVVKSPSGEQLMDKGAPNDATTAVLSTINQTGMAQSDDLAATREVVSPTTLPLDYQYNEKQMLANVSVAISSDIEDMTETELLQDETFGYASKKMFRAFRGEDFTGTDEEATQYGIDLMRRVENNLVELGSFSHKVQNMNQDDAKVALYMLDMFEAKEFTGRGFAEALGYMGQDPTTYIGLGTFGWGFAGKEAAKQATKQGIKATLQKIAYSGAAAGAIEGGVYTGAFEHGKQVVSEAAGEGYDSGSLGLNVAMGTGFGAAAGKYLPEIFDYAGEKVAKWSAAKNFKAEVQAAADAGDEDAIQVLADMELLDSHYGVKEYLAGKLDEFEQTRVGQAVTGVQRATDSSGKIIEDKELIVQHNITEENIKHSEKVGGLAVPSLAITKKDTPLSGFGEITLLGNSELTKPSRETRVFAADVYSPRYPQIHYSLTAKQQRVIDEDLAPYELITGSKDYAEKDSLNALYENTAFRAKFLDEKGVKVKLPKSPKANIDSMRAYKKYYKNIVDIDSHFFEHDLARDVDFQKAYIQELKDTDPAMLIALDIGEPKGIEASDELIRLADRRALKLSSLGKQNKKAGQPDEYEVKRVIREAINKKKLGGELKSFASDYLKEKGAKETIYNGTDRMGRAKYIEHSLSNVIQKLKKDIRGGESFNYGIGTTRAKLTPEFKTIAAIKKNKDRLVSSSDFEKVKEEMSAKIDEISEKLKPYYEYDSDSFGYQAEVLHAIGDQDLRGYGFKEMPEHIKEDINEITTALKEMPTEYFETKILKALDIGEFTAAIVPNGTSKETINLLKNKGLKVTKYNPSNEKARTEAISNAAEKQNILFMHPATIGGAITAAAISQTEGDNDDK